MNSILNDLDSIIKEKAHEGLRHVRGLLIKRGIEVPSKIGIITANNFYFCFPDNSKPVIFYDENNNTIFLDGHQIKEDILKIINTYDKNYKKSNNQLSYVLVSLEYQLLSRNPTTRENYIIIPIKLSQLDEYIIKNYIKFVLLPGIWSSIEGIRNSELPKKEKEYAIYTLGNLSYYLTYYKNSGLPNNVFYISLYNTMECTDILKSATSLINEDPFTVGTCTGYDLLVNRSSNGINLKKVYEKLIKDPYHFLEEYSKQSK
jgi:hypothetical protein